MSIFKDHYAQPLAYPFIASWKEPTTSRDAAIAIEASGTAQRLRKRILDALREPQTAKEVAALIGVDINSARPRITELKEQNLVRATGDRRNGQHVWVMA